MQFSIVALDGTDEQALPRRLAAREAHLALSAKMANAGTLLHAVALLDDNGKMIGSNMIYEFPSRADLDAYLAQEPYVLGNIWQDITVRPCRVSPSFAKA